MARLLTAGAEVDGGIAAASIDFGPITGTVTRDTTTFRSGLASWKFDSGAGNALAWTVLSSTLVASTTYYFRAYCRFAGFPSFAVSPAILGFGTNRSTTGIELGIDNGGGLRWYDPNTGLSILGGSGSVRSASNLNQWYRIEASITLNGSSQITDFSYLLDGVQGTSYTGKTIAITATGQSMGWVQQVPGASLVFNIDDVALNDSTGTQQNTWPGEGSIVLVKPNADSAIGTGWTLGTGTAIASNSGSTAVKNVPPVGVADLTAGSDTKQIRNATSNANVNYDATMQTYTAAGVPSTDFIAVVVPIISTAAPVTTSAKQGTVGVVSNPTITNIALGAGGTSGAFWSGVAAGTYPTGWKWSFGTTTYLPTVTLGTAPVMRVTQVTSSTRIAIVDSMGIYVESKPYRSLIHNPRQRIRQMLAGR